VRLPWGRFGSPVIEMGSNPGGGSSGSLRIPAAASYSRFWSLSSTPSNAYRWFPCPYPYENRPLLLACHLAPDAMLESTGLRDHRTKDRAPVTAVTNSIQTGRWSHIRYESYHVSHEGA
jgi:hypothetical protein